MPHTPAAPIALLFLSLVVGAVSGLLLAAVAGRLMAEARVRPLHRIVATAGGAALFVLVVLRFGTRPETPAYLLLAAGCIVLAVVDLGEKRLPNAVILPTTVLVAVALILAAEASGQPGLLVGALAGGVALFAIYLVLALISPGGIGLGDVKLAFVLGAAAGYLGLRAWLGALVAGFVLNAAASVLALLARRVTLRSSVPFGPAMIAGAFLAILLG